jgi:hypothetical protein
LAAVDLDGDERDELVVGTTEGRLTVLSFSEDCSSVTASKSLNVCDTVPCMLAALLPVPTTVAPAGLVAVRATGARPFALLRSDGLQLATHGMSDLNVAASSDSWIAAAASANRSELLLVRARSAVVLATGADGKTTVVAQHNSTLSGRSTNEWHSAAVVDFAGDGRNVAVLVDSSTSPHATMLEMPSMRLLGGGHHPQQLMDTNYSWSSVAVASLSDTYGALHNPPSSARARLPPLQQLIGLRFFPQLATCPWYRGANRGGIGYGDNISGVFCCRTNENNSCTGGDWNFGGDVTQPSDVPCCLRAGSKLGCGYGDLTHDGTVGGCTKTGCAQAAPCGVAPTPVVTSGSPTQYLVSLLVFGDGTLWQPRKHAMAQSLLSQDSIDYTGAYSELVTNLLILRCCTHVCALRWLSIGGQYVFIR